ncbi:MAG: alpha/beta hydrolase [Clostridia bacterium]|nr:alpha/beta hydrolase [Clostridia bacterium]
MKHQKRMIALALVLMLCIGGWAYVSDYYPADETAISAMASVSGIAVQQCGSTLAFVPEQAETGFIFYPGGKVEYTAYAPLMRELAENGVLCVLTEMPMNLAVLDMNAADGIPEQYPQVDHWYIGGRSLGGSMAASYAAKNADRYEGLVLLASYSTADLSASCLNVISLYGSEDGVLNMDKYAGYKANLPAVMEEHVIEGGCHAGFGSYGAQEGDGTASISGVEQLQLTAQVLTDFFD